MILKTPKEIKRDLLRKFRSELDRHDIISPKWLLHEYWRMLTSKEKEHFKQAVSDLIQKGIIEKVGGRIPSLRLTEKGADLLC